MNCLPKKKGGAYLREGGLIEDLRYLYTVLFFG